jgi:large subunit ribosomal protein L25
MGITFKKRAEKLSEGYIPGVLYGPGLKNVVLEISSKDFEKTYKEIGETSLVVLESGSEKYQVLIHDIQKDPLTGMIIHVDFYQPNLKQEVEVTVPLVFEGEPPAVKELGGTLVKNILEVDVKALPEKLPHEIKVNVEKLKNFEDAVLIKDLEVPQGVEILKDPEETVALVTPIQDIERDLEKPIEGDVESVEKIETKKEEEEKDE